MLNNPTGSSLIGALNCANFNPQINKYFIPSTDATDLFMNDCVRTNYTSNSEGIPICVKANAGEPLRGVVVAFEKTHPFEDITFREAGTNRYVYVADYPFSIYTMQVNGELTTNDIGKNANIINNGGNTITGQSNTQLDITTLSTLHGQFKILSILEVVNDDLGTYTTVKCIIFNSELISSSASVTVGFKEELIPISDGNTIFTLTLGTPIYMLDVVIDGVVYTQVAGDFTIGGNTLTWVNPIILNSTNTMVARYFI